MTIACSQFLPPHRSAGETGLSLGQFIVALAVLALFVAVAYGGGGVMGEGFLRLVEDLT